MTELTPINRQLPWTYLFHGQGPHLLLLLLLVPGALAWAGPSLDGTLFWGFSDRQWVYLLLTVVILHQLLAWLGWRLQLCFSSLSRWFGQADLVVWCGLFFPFLVARPVLLAIVGLSDAGSLGLPPLLSGLLGLGLLIPALYTVWSVYHYFGFIRAAGGDHFRARYWHLPLVNQGIFRYSTNAMYVFGFGLLWAIALLTRSQAALALALFQHAYIWVHWYCTEQPDLKVLFP